VKKKTLRDVALYGATEGALFRCFEADEKPMAERRLAALYADDTALEFVRKIHKEQSKDPF